MTAGGLDACYCARVCRYAYAYALVRTSLKEMYSFNWNFQRGRGLIKKPFFGRYVYFMELHIIIIIIIILRRS